MNKLVQELIRPFLEGENKYDIVVYGGGFKPPTLGHLNVAKAASSIPSFEYYIAVGSKVRDNIDQDTAIKIWQLYQNKEGLDDSIKVIGVNSPIKYMIDLAKENPDAKIALVAGSRGEEDDQDIAKIKKSLDKYGISLEVISTQDEGISGTRVRQALQSKNKEDFLQSMPPNSGEEIWNIITRSLIPENQEQKNIGYRAGRFNPNSPAERLKDKGIGVVNSKVGLLGTGHYFMGSLEDAQKLKKQLGYPVISQINLDSYNLYRPNDPVNFYENLKATTHYLHGLKPKDLDDPQIKENVKDAIRGFAEYLNLDPKKTAAIFKQYLIDIFKRNDGDLLSNRLLSNYDGIDLRGTDFDDFGAGSIIFNGKLKSDTYSELTDLQEGRYDQETLIISRFVFNQFKENLGNRFEEDFEIGLLENIEYTLELKFVPNDTLGPPFFTVAGGADENALEVVINYDPSIFPKSYNILIAEIKDTVRHELEHVGQFNFPKNVKPRRGDDPEGFDYYSASYEIPAFVQGIYKLAKTRKISFSQALEEFLEEREFELTPREIDRVRQLYLNYAKKNLPAAQLDEGVKDLRPKIQAIMAKYQMSAKEFSDQLKKGTEVEKEHTSNPTVAMKIALDHIDENPKYYDILATVGLEEEYTPQKDELQSLILDFTSFLVTDGMKLHPFPKIKFEQNKEEANNPLGKTAYYNPEEQSITLFILNRHPKDILRSYSHELVHHMQNLEGRLKPMTTTNVHEDSELAEIEKEAHELGSLNLRRWEDSKKVGLQESPQEYKIYSDMDGVITDFDERFQSISNGVPPREYEEKNGKTAFWDLIASKGVGWWVGMPWMPDGKEYWNYIKDYNVELLSAPSRENSSRLGKRLWVKNNLPGVKLNLLYAEDKQKLAAPNHILIDDRSSNIEQWRAQGGIGILHTSAADTIKQLKDLGL